MIVQKKEPDWVQILACPFSLYLQALPELYGSVCE
jgi:hypothetical protein